MTLVELFCEVDGRPSPPGVYANIRSFPVYDEVTWAAADAIGGWFWAIVQGSEVVSFGHAVDAKRLRAAIAIGARLAQREPLKRSLYSS